MLNPLTHRKILKTGLPGTANVVTRGVYSPNASSFNLAMTLQVYVEGITPYEVEDNWMVKAKDTVALGGAIPVRVDPDDHQRVAIDWDGVRSGYEQQETARRQALAASGPAGPQAPGLAGSPEVMRQVEQALGQAGVQLQQAASVGSGSPAADDPVGKLERLAALRASGALTEEEFQEQKRRILG